MLSLAFEVSDPLLKPADLLTQRLETRAQTRRHRGVGIFDQRADVGDDLARPHRNRKAEFAEQPAKRVETRRPRSDPRGAHAMERGDGLLGHGLHRDEVNLLVACRFEQRFRVGAIGLVAANIRPRLMRREQPDRMPQLLERPRPVMRRPARFQQHRRRRPGGKKRHESRTAQPMLFIHPSRLM